MDYRIESTNDDKIVPLRVDTITVSDYYGEDIWGYSVNDNFSIMGEAETYTFDPKIPYEQRRGKLESALQELVREDQQKRNLQTIFLSSQYESRLRHIEQNPGMYAYELGKLLHRLEIQDAFSQNYFA